MFTPMDCHHALCEFLEKEVASSIKLHHENRIHKVSFENPKVIRSGYILPKSIGEATYLQTEGYDRAEYHLGEEYPFIIPSIDNVSNSGGEWASTVTFNILFGVNAPSMYDEKGIAVKDSSGYRDIWNLIERTRQRLFEVGVIGERFRIIQDFFEAGLVDELRYPYWEGYCKVRFQVAYIVPDIDFNSPNSYS